LRALGDLGIAQEEEERTLQLLQRSGLIELREGKFHVTGGHFVDTQGGLGALHRLKQHWAQVGVARIDHPNPKTDLFAYNVVSVSRGDLAKIRELVRSTYREIRSVVASSQPEEVVAVLNLQLFAFPDTETDG
jgi:hypothetical protein